MSIRCAAFQELLWVWVQYKVNKGSLSRWAKPNKLRLHVSEIMSVRGNYVQ